MIKNHILDNPKELDILLKNDAELLFLQRKKHRIYLQNRLEIVVDTKSKIGIGYRKEIQDLLDEIEHKEINRKVKIFQQFYKK